MSQQHLCFYSARCRVCQAFLEQMAQTPFSKEFRFICVDPGPDGRRPQLPAYVKAVPTLMIAGEPEPRVDNNVMNWLMERRLKSRSDVAPGGGFMGAATGMGGASAGGAGGGPMALYANELGGLGDEGFAFIGEEGFSGEKSTVRLSSTMTGINDVAHSMVPDARVFGAPPPSAAGGGMGTGAAGGGTGRQSEKAKAFDTAYQSFLADRDRGMPKGIQRM